MLSPGYLIVPQATKQAVNTRVGETSPNGTNAVIAYHQPHNIPIRCIQTIMPPPPNNILSTISNNNNNVTKCYSRNGSWSNSKKYSKEGKGSKKNDSKKEEKEKEKHHLQDNVKNSPENKG